MVARESRTFIHSYCLKNRKETNTRKRPYEDMATNWQPNNNLLVNTWSIMCGHSCGKLFLHALRGPECGSMWNKSFPIWYSNKTQVNLIRNRAVFICFCFVIIETKHIGFFTILTVYLCPVLWWLSSTLVFPYFTLKNRRERLGTSLVVFTGHGYLLNVHVSMIIEIGNFWWVPYVGPAEVNNQPTGHSHFIKSTGWSSNNCKCSLRLPH